METLVLDHDRRDDISGDDRRIKPVKNTGSFSLIEEYLIFTSLYKNAEKK